MFHFIFGPEHSSTWNIDKKLKLNIQIYETANSLDLKF